MYHAYWWDALQVTDEFLQKILADLIDQVPRDQLQHVIIVFDSLGGQIKSQYEAEPIQRHSMGTWCCCAMP